MMLAVSRPAAIAGVILNDIGPVTEPRGWVRIKSYVKDIRIPRNFEEGAEILRWWLETQFPKLTPQDWIAFAQRTWREHRGRLVPDYDPKLARMLQGADLQHPRSVRCPEALSAARTQIYWLQRRLKRCCRGAINSRSP
jgi:hypothetical protein